MCVYATFSLPTVRHLGWLYLLAVGKNAALNMDV